VSRVATALRSVRSAAENRRAESLTIATSPAISVGVERNASAITERGSAPPINTVPPLAAAIRAAAATCAR